MSLVGCSAAPPPPTTTPSYARAIDTICSVDRLAGLSADEDPLNIGQKRTEWISNHVDDPDAIYFRTMLSVKGPDEQATALREEARKLKLSSCTLADSIDQNGTGALSP